MTYDEALNTFKHLSRPEQIKMALLIAPTKKTQRQIAKDLDVHESLVCIYLKGKRKKNLDKIEAEVKKLYQQ